MAIFGKISANIGAASATLSSSSRLYKLTVAACCANCRQWNRFWQRVKWRVKSSCQEAIKARVQRVKPSLHLIIKTLPGTALLVAPFARASTSKAPSKSSDEANRSTPALCPQLRLMTQITNKKYVTEDMRPPLSKIWLSSQYGQVNDHISPLTWHSD